MMETIEETTVGMLGQTRMAMASMVFEGEYVRPDGSVSRGLSCVLVPLDPEGKKIWAGLGSIVKIHDSRWEVVDIAKQPGQNGYITLKQLR